MTRKDCALCSTSYLICDNNNEVTGINISPKYLTLGMLKRDNKTGIDFTASIAAANSRYYFIPLNNEKNFEKRYVCWTNPSLHLRRSHSLTARKSVV